MHRSIDQSAPDYRRGVVVDGRWKWALSLGFRVPTSSSSRVGVLKASAFHFDQSAPDYRRGVVVDGRWKWALSLGLGYSLHHPVESEFRRRLRSTSSHELSVRRT